MTARLEGEVITSGGNFDWTGQGSGNLPADNLTQYRDCTISNEGPGSAVITVDYGSGANALATLAADDYDTYLVPGARNINITASGGNCTVDIISSNKNT